VCALPDPYRVALYYAPAVTDPLWACGSTWLGRDAATGAAVAQPDVANLAEQTTDPRRYGFHATLKPPMRLAGSLGDFLSNVNALARRLESFVLPTLAVTQIGKFLALCPTCPSPALQHLADACVTELDAHRLPEDAAAQAKRAVGCSARQLRNLERWGYPLVLEDWRFHMTLSNSIENNPLRASAEAFFSDALRYLRRVETLTVFAQAEPGAAFEILENFRLGQ
jgi:Protein of unknown function (DUF1045)